MKESKLLTDATAKVETLRKELKKAIWHRDGLRVKEWPYFEIWRRGYNHTGTGKRGGAKRLGVYHGKDFRDACDRFYLTKGMALSDMAFKGLFPKEKADV